MRRINEKIFIIFIYIYFLIFFSFSSFSSKEKKTILWFLDKGIVIIETFPNKAPKTVKE